MDFVSSNQEAETQARRTANYKPNIWNYEHLQSCLSAKYDEENKYEGEAEILREEVRCIIGASNDPIYKLELIDGITKLGISYYFEEEINKSIKELSCKQSTISPTTEHNDLYSIALYFRVLRQHGYHVPQDGILQMLDDEDTIMTTHLDEKAMVEVYEASHLALKGEYCLFDRVKAFIAARNIDSTKCPCHWSVSWFNVKQHILKEQNKSTLHRLAGLNFNMVQVQHQKDLNETLTWWKNLDLSEALTFTRDRAVESFLWTVGVAYEPQYGKFRKWFTKAIILVLVIDDMYDIYGSDHELQQFTVAVERWDPKEIQHLPGAIKRCFWALHDTAIEIDLDIQTEKGWNSVLLYLKKVWAGFCKALYKEAEWYHKGHCPSLCEYLDNGWISSSGHLLSLHTLLGVGQDITQTMAAFNDNQQLIHHASLIIRLYNDQATSKAELERGDAPSSILCRMRDENSTEQEARDHLQNLITESWGKMNELFIRSCPHSQQPMVRFILNLARVVNFIYQNGDGYGVQDRETRKQVLECLFEPVPLC